MAAFDVVKLREELNADKGIENADIDLSGTSLPGIRTTLYEIFDNDDLTEMELYLKNRIVHKIDIRSIDYFVVVSSPMRK
jgi:hypothetical protein